MSVSSQRTRLFENRRDNQNGIITVCQNGEAFRLNLPVFSRATLKITKVFRGLVNKRAIMGAYVFQCDSRRRGA
jgi:hypothetical protein